MQDDKLIAEFMGVNVITLDEVRSNKNPRISSADGYTCDDLQYHTSWDWLMPVAQKIEDYLSDNIGKVGYFDDGLISNDIEVRYQSVVEFIKEHNDEQRQNN